MKTTQLPFFTLLLMISFASVNAVLFTPALPEITQFFSVTHSAAQLTITWFLIGYALGQLIYGPIANRLGRKPALYIGVSLQIFSSLLCVISGSIHSYALLIIGRFLSALGSAVGLKMTFTLVNECYDSKTAAQKISYLLLAFAVTPGLGVALGGLLTKHFGWMSCFYVGALYGLLLLMFVIKLPETQKILDYHAFKLKHLLTQYSLQFSNKQLVVGGLLMGTVTCFIYSFAAIAPFIAIKYFGMNSASYGFANLLPPIGLLLGAILSARLIRSYSPKAIMKMGILASTLGAFLMCILILLNFNAIDSIFFPTMIIYFGLSFIPANASSMALSQACDKAHGSAVMNFINVGFATCLVLGLGFFPVYPSLLPILYVILSGIMIINYRCLSLLSSEK
jgi:DHA1 family bicyclomycin/chloramphenicol resistance-like MFS transporter